MLIQPYLIFDGNCAEAFRHYHELLGGELQMHRMGDAPGQAGAADEADLIMHARLEVGGQVLMGSDAPEGRREPRGSYSISLTADGADEARRIFDGLAQGAKVHMPLSPTFWSPLFGMLEDRFGTRWMVTVPGPA
jgi:PhnB protein